MHGALLPHLTDISDIIGLVLYSSISFPVDSAVLANVEEPVLERENHYLWVLKVIWFMFKFWITLKPILMSP